MYFFVLVLLIAASFFKKNSKGLFYLLYFFIFFVAVSFKEGHDLSYFELGFDNSIFLDTDHDDKSLVFRIYGTFLKSIGLSFYQFRIVCFLIWSIPLFFFIRHFSKCSALVAGLCSMFPILVFASQIRNGVAMGFVYLAFFSLLKRSDLKGILLFVALICIGGLIHNSVFVYLLGLIAVKPRPKVRPLFSVSLIIILFSSSIIGSGLLGVIVSELFGEYYANFYFSQLEPFVFGNIHYFIGLFINLWFCYQADIILRGNYGRVSSELIRFSTFVFRLNIVLIALTPLLLITLSFYRIYQNIFVLSVISVMNASLYCHGGRKKRVDNHRECSQGQLIVLRSGMRKSGVYFRTGYALLYLIITFLYQYGQGTFFEFWNSVSM